MLRILSGDHEIYWPCHRNNTRQGDELQRQSDETCFVSNSKSGQKYTNIHTKWTDFKRKQVYLPFPCHQCTQYYPQTSNFNIESLTCQFCCTHDTSTLHQTGNPCEGKSLLGEAHQTNFSAMFTNINLKNTLS